MNQKLQRTALNSRLNAVADWILQNFLLLERSCFRNCLSLCAEDFVMISRTASEDVNIHVRTQSETVKTILSVSTSLRFKIMLSLLFLPSLHITIIIFTARCTLVCLSLCPPVTLVDCDHHIGWNSSEIISPLVSLGCSLCRPKHRGSTPRGTPGNFGPKVTHPC